MDIHVKNRNRCIIALVLCSLTFITVFISVLIGVTAKGSYEYLGLDNLRYFTYESNIFAGMCAFLCIPFQIDGLRNKNYHLPRWLVNILYISVCTVTITLLLAGLFVLPFKGFYLTYLDKGNIFVHLLSPLLAIIAFIYINDDHELKNNMLWCSFIPIVFYVIVYFIEVFVKGYWKDHYHILEYVPPAFAIVIVVVAYFAISYLVMKLHNKRHKLAKDEIKEYYMNSVEVSCPTIDEAIMNLAIRNRNNDKGGDLIVPRRIILMMEDKYKSGKSLNDLCNIYITNYLDK